MNICQISTHDLLLCLQNGNLDQAPFFQQVVTIAAAGHLVCISDYAIGACLQAELADRGQKQLNQLLDVIDIWEVSPQAQQQAEDLSQSLKISLADAIDQGIYVHLNPDLILVADGGRSLPNAAPIDDFWQDWRSIRDDLPPNGGVDRPKLPTQGGGSPGQGAHPSGASPPHNMATASPDATNSVVFSHRNFVNWSMGLYYANNSGPITGPTIRASAPTNPVIVGTNRPIVQPQLIQPQLIQPQGSKTAPINIRVLIDRDTATPTIVILSDAEVKAQSELVTGTANPSRLSSHPEFGNGEPVALRSSGLIATANPTITATKSSTPNLVQFGTLQNDQLQAGSGNDILVGGGGGDRLDGGAGIDTASYANAPMGVTVSLATGLGTAGEAQGDRLVAIENLEGSPFNDTLVGDRQDNVLLGRGGNDTLIGGLGNDILQGGPGNNRLVGDRLPNVPSRPQATPGYLASQPVDQPMVNLAANLPVDLAANLPVDLISHKGDTSTTPPPVDRRNPDPIGIMSAPAAPVNRSTPPIVINLSDWIFADAGDDVIDAGDGNNFVAAGAGNNQVDSGDGQDLFVLSPGPGVTTIRHYQRHDRLGLMGGIAYADLTLTPIEPTSSPNASSSAPPQLKISVNRNGIEDILAIVVGVNRLSREAFLTVEYQADQPVVLNAGATQVIPDWLSASHRSRHTLQVPTIGQLAPHLGGLDPTATRWAA